MSKLERQPLVGKYKPYPEYKDSRVEWLGVIPTHWSLHALKRTVSDCRNGIWGDEPNEDDDLIVLRVADFDRNKLTVSDGKLTYRSISEKERKTRLLKKGDLLIEKSGGGEKTLVGCVVIFDKDYSAVTSNFVAKMSPRKTYCSNFLRYAFSHLYAGRVNYPSIKQTTGIQNLDSDSYLMEHFCFPDSSEQQTIAAFLDYETARIDRLITQQQRLIELLKEKRQAVISHAVTKGLNPNAPMKDSGVEWLGQVPEHWGIRAINQATKKITNGYVGPTRDILVDNGVPYIQATHIKNGRVNFDDGYFVTKSWSNKKHKSILMAGDVLIVQTGAGTGDIGLVTEFEQGYNCHALIILQPMGEVIDGSYLSLILRSAYGQSVLYSIRTGGMHPHLNCSEVKFVKIPVPSLEEQRAIYDFVLKINDVYSRLMDVTTKQIALMQERRTALISAAVTGKIDLRGWTPQGADLHG
ncbi:TPA: restriction endonuclease subunit S [Aeromonas hydrophila]|uniref:restriction endonuclease subunit S n=1 Tax=Aeromonas caviae TaxID=648 RepID=UPI00002985B6|nr:restriction endonuclease subunit S [Aeromonas caviae]HAT2488426.1 restriction endonuclease subunit S [Aeromonas hydrophila]HAT2493282.1 restriction endonuclease subunit S [Aeromonas hydrophila]HAT2508628.1 restriction endonuclease subunit S [Aeromonas hydrophila]HAT2529076.1 restriction endonuclease subunit S [Aeromonas hydrophila]HEG4447903.1 restriction endonuclease subunit S [Aeromonas hydrophila]